jgi:hypothetical protein
MKCLSRDVPIAQQDYPTLGYINKRPSCLMSSPPCVGETPTLAFKERSGIERQIRSAGARR